MSCQLWLARCPYCDGDEAYELLCEEVDQQAKDAAVPAEAIEDLEARCGAADDVAPAARVD